MNLVTQIQLINFLSVTDFFISYTFIFAKHTCANSGLSKTSFSLDGKKI